MRRVVPLVLTALAVVVLPHVLRADDAKRPERPGPEAFFKRLDANHDGQVTVDEVPEKAPERLKAMLKRADKDGDKKVSLAEFAEAIKQHRPAPPTAERRRPGPPRPPATAHRRPGTPPTAHRRPGPPSHHHAMPQRRPMPSAAGRFAPKLPDPKAVFARLDRNKDQKLSLEEFTAGMRALHRGPMGMPHRPTGMPHRPMGPPHRSMPGHVGPMRHPGSLGEAMFKRADANNDGKVSLDEVPEKMREGFKKFLEKADKDGDKALSAEEGKAAAEAMKKAMMARVKQAMEARKKAWEERKAAMAKRAAEAKEKAAPPEKPERKRPERKKPERKKPEEKK